VTVVCVVTAGTVSAGCWQVCEAAVVQEQITERGVREQEGVFVLFGAAAGALQSGLLQVLPCGVGQQVWADGTESAGAAFFAVFFVQAAEESIGASGERADDFRTSIRGQLQVQHVARWLSPDRCEGEQSQRQRAIGGLSDRTDDLRFGNFFAGDAGDVRTFMQELKQRCSAVEAGAADDIADVVAAQTGAGGEQNVVLAADFQFVSFQDHGVGRTFFANRQELEEMRLNFEDAGGLPGFEWQGHAPFTGVQSVVPDGNIFADLFEVLAKGGGAASGPDTKHLQTGPDFAGSQFTAAFEDIGKLSGASGLWSQFSAEAVSGGAVSGNLAAKSVPQVADERFRGRIDFLEELHECGWIRRHEYADVRVCECQHEREAAFQRLLINFGDIGRDGVQRPHDGVLHGRHQAADVATGSASGGERATMAAGDLHDIQVRQLRKVLVDTNTPLLPASAIVVQKTAGDRDSFAGMSGAAGECEHQQAVLWSEQGGVITGGHAVDPWPEEFVICDGNAAAKFGQRHLRMQLVVTRKTGVGVELKQVFENGTLDFAAVGVGRVEKPGACRGESSAQRLSQQRAELVDGGNGWRLHGVISVRRDVRICEDRIHQAVRQWQWQWQWGRRRPEWQRVLR